MYGLRGDADVTDGRAAAKTDDGPLRVRRAAAQARRLPRTRQLVDRLSAGRSRCAFRERRSNIVAEGVRRVETYDIAIIGTGSGNSILDDRYAHKRVAMCEQGTFGGTCLNVGCVPTKMFVYAAEVAQTVRDAARSRRARDPRRAAPCAPRSHETTPTCPSPRSARLGCDASA